MKFFYPVFFCFLSFSTFSLSAQIINDNGTGKTYNLTAGQTLNITKGVFNGKIDALPAGATITIVSGAQFNPTSFAADAAGTIINEGTANLGNQTFNSKILVQNHGTIIGGTIGLQNIKLNNYQYATVRFSTINFSWNPGDSAIINN